MPFKEASMQHPTSCGQNILDTQVNGPYTASNEKQVLINERIIIAINAEGIPCFTGSCSEIYLEKAFASAGLRPRKRLPVAKELGETVMMFLVHPTLSENDMRDTVKAVEKVMKVASK